MWHSCLKSKNRPGGGAVWLQTPNTQHAAGPVRRKKKSTIGLDTKIRPVFVLIILVTQGALESSESLQRGKMRERGRDGARGGDRGGEGVRERKGKRAAGVSGPQAVAGSWDQRLEGGSCLGGAWPFRVQCQVSEPSGQWSLPLSQHRTKYVPKLLCLQIQRQRESLKRGAAVKSVNYLWRIVWMLEKYRPVVIVLTNIFASFRGIKNSWNLRLGMSTLLS